MKQTKTVYAVVWTKKGAEARGEKEGDTCIADGVSSNNQWFEIDYLFFKHKKDAQIARDGNKNIKVVKMEITYKEV